MVAQKVFKISKVHLMNWIFKYKIVILNNDDISRAYTPKYGLIGMKNHPYKQVVNNLPIDDEIEIT